jgi:hypothetical protein
MRAIRMLVQLTGGMEKLDPLRYYILEYVAAFLVCTR